MAYDYDPEWKRGQEDRSVALLERPSVVYQGDRRKGEPRSDVERVANHYGITIEEAVEWLMIHPVEELLPERGSGLPSVVYQGIPGGGFTSPYIEVIGHPDNIVPVGEKISLRCNYWAECPGQPWYAPAWTVAVKVKGDGILAVANHTYMTGGHVTDFQIPNYPSVPTMPDKEVTLEVTLWGNPGAWLNLHDYPEGT